LDGLVAAPVLRLAASLVELPADVLPELLRERLNEGEQALLERGASGGAPAAPPDECVHAIRRLRVERESAAVQNEIDRLQRGAGMDDRTLSTLWERKKELLRRLDDLT
jgi:hypothetical protein